MGQPSRPSLRLRGFDYSSRFVYAVTFCTARREPLLASFQGEELILLVPGQIVRRCWLALPERFPDVTLILIVIMPDHVHAMLLLDDAKGSLPRGRSSLIDVIAALKSTSAIAINRWLGRRGMPVWQRSFHDRVIRCEAELEAMWRYFVENPQRWLARRDRP